MGKNGWHDDNRRGVDIPCGNQAHYRSRLWARKSNRGVGGIERIIILRIHPRVPLSLTSCRHVACEKLRIARFKGRRRGEIAAQRSSINQDSSISR